MIYILLMCAMCACRNSDSGSGDSGQGGSLARFAINLNYLYVASNYSIAVYDITENNFKKIKDINIDFGLETIQVKSPYLYLGANDGMYIYSISNPSSPEFIFKYEHILTCDPVVVQGNRAYVTLRSGTECANRGTNILEIIDISDPKNPKLITTYTMTSPGGLAIDGTCLFVCEGTVGVKMLNVENDRVQLLNEIKNVNAYDIIAGNGKLTLTGADGIFQYRYVCGTASLELISKIPVQRDPI